MKFDAKKLKVNPQQVYEHMQKESVPCNICGAENLIDVLDRDRYGMGIKTVICESCGFLFTSPRPVPAAMSEFYRTTYRKFYTGTKNPKKEYEDKLHVQKREWLYERVKGHIEKRGKKNPKILDVGCGAGALLNVFRRNLPDSELHGVEPTPEFARYAQERNGATVYNGGVAEFFHEHRGLQGSFDVITLYHVLEHLYNPADFLITLRDFLVPGGLLLIQVPNALSPHWQNAIQMFHIAHISHFSLSTLRHAYQVAGFRVLYEFDGPHPGNPRALTLLGEKTDSLLPKADIPRLTADRVQSITKSIRESAAPLEGVSFARQFLLTYKRKGVTEALRGLAGYAKHKVRKFAMKMEELFGNFKHRGIKYGFEKLCFYFAQNALKIARLAKKAVVFTYGSARISAAWSLHHLTNDAPLRKLIRGRRVLILGSGPSAKELGDIPDDVLIFTCNAGLRLLRERGIDRPVDLYLCRKKAMTADYPDIEGLLAEQKANVYVMDDARYVKTKKSLKGAYEILLPDHQKDNFYLNKLMKPDSMRFIREDEVTWTSAGIRLLQYALYFKASGIFMIGIDLSNNGYFWGPDYAHRLPTEKKGHKHSIDFNFLRFMARRHPNLYSLSPSSPVSSHLPCRNFDMTSPTLAGSIL
ncbi:MAG: methyltransferase domain-containing protein [Candidatus Omnitrophota bacterium]|nr:methyltransferase domain-containing protein [Candidatus Omnitrophota bacterium]